MSNSNIPLAVLFPGLAALIVLLGIAFPGSAFSACEPTPSQGEGPYYPVQVIPLRPELIAPGAQPAGEVIVVSGRVMDTRCRPIAQARVEFWQTDGAGRYNHPGDSSAAGRLDPAFRYFGAAETDGEGRYTFRTLFPGAYGEGSWRRPSHIHVKVKAPNRPTLTTQLYFAGDPRLKDDWLIGRLSPQQRNALIAVLAAPPVAPVGAREPRATFDIVLPAQ